MTVTQKKGHIYLVGFMGSGKSTVGALLAEELGLPFVDLDNLIEREAGVSIAEIFRDSGEGSFRRLETEILARQSALPPSVTALGGGAFSSLRNREIVQCTGLSVWLKVDLETARERCLDTERPLAQDPEMFTRLFQNRQAYYRKADLHVETTRRTPRDIASEIIQELKKLPHALD
jgi:shikimate kinase